MFSTGMLWPSQVWNSAGLEREEAVATPYYRVKKAAHDAREVVRDACYRAWERAKPFAYEPDRYDGEFIVNTPAPHGPLHPVENKIYSFWTGDNPVTPNRRKGLDSLHRLNPDLEVALVTPQNLADYVLPQHPLHPAYENLSLVHRSDYLRCYFMHFFGGGYADVKTYEHAWAPSFQLLESSTHAYALGYREVSSYKAAGLPGELGRDIKLHYSILIACGAFIMRPQTPLTQEWYGELLRRMDHYASRLAECPGDARGSNPGYPIRWTGVLGDILQPVCLKYHDRLIIDDRLRPILKNYH